MRRQDELLAVYREQPLLARKFILCQAETLALGFDSDELRSFLQGLLADPEAVIRNQAFFSLVRFLPGFFDRKYGLSEQLSGAWTGVSFNLDQLRKEFEGEAAAEANPDLDRVWSWKAKPLSGPLLEIAGSRIHPLRHGALMTLSQLPLEEVRGWLYKQLASAPQDFPLLLAYAVLVEKSAGDRTFIDYLRQNVVACPDLALLLPACDPLLLSDLILELIPKTETLARCNLALVLGQLPQADHGEAFRKLLDCKDPWVTLFVLHAIERLKNPKHLAFVKEVLDQGGSEFIRTHAARVLGFLKGDASRDLCFHLLKGDGEKVRGQALESLARQGIRDEASKGIAHQLLESKSLKVKIQAMLVLNDPASARLREVLQEILFSNVPLERLEAAFFLGYSRDPAAPRYLEALANQDPSVSVRTQAVKSLANQPAAESVPALLALLEEKNPRFVESVLRALTRYEKEGAERVIDGLVELTKRGAGLPASSRAGILRTLGMIAARSGKESAGDALAAGIQDEDTEVVHGALEGWMVFGREGDPAVKKRVESLSAGGVPGARPPAMFCRVTRGDLEVLEPLAQLVPGESAALDAALELTFVMGRPKIMTRLPGLARALNEAMGSREFAQLDAQVLTSRRDRPSAFESGVGQDLDSLYDLIRDDEKPAAPKPAQAPPSRKPAPTSPTPPPKVGEESGVQRLRQHLTSGRTVRASGGSMEFSSRIGVPPPPGPTLLERLKKPGTLPLLTLGVVILVPLLIMAFGRTSGPKRPGNAITTPPADTRLIVSKVTGEAKLSPLKEPPEPGTPVPEDAVVTTGVGAEILFLSRENATIRVGGESELTFVSLEDKKPIEVKVEAGDYMFDFKKGRFVVDHKDSVITGEDARLYLVRQGNRFRAVSDTGRVEVSQPAGISVKLEAGIYHTLSEAR